MLRIPKMSAPLVKLTRTLEGLLVLGSNIALVLVPIVTTSLSAKEAATLGVILNGTTVISRSVLKAVAALNVAGLPAPVVLLSAEHQKQLTDDLSTVAAQAAGDVGKGASASTVVGQVEDDITAFAGPPPPPAPGPAFETSTSGNVMPQPITVTATPTTEQVPPVAGA